MPTIAPVLIPLSLFVDAAVELDGEAEASMEDARDVSGEIVDGTAVFRDMVVDVAVALVVTAIVYPAAE